MFISRQLFKDQPGGVLRLPYIEKLSNDNSVLSKVLVFICSIGLKEEEKGKGYVGKMAVGFVFDRIFYKILSPIIIGHQPTLGMFERVELERELAKKKKNEEEKKPERPRVNLDKNEDLEKEFGANIIEMSEVE